ncbi:protein-tyrosine phosphatase-like protein [Mycena olivaceomarginata]|nr:protein-tyrosine phosphatase-like protein [Mycena olivaceomarginata]
MSSIPRRSTRMDSSPTREDVTEILPNLFLGSEAGAQNLRMLRSRGITHILSVMAVPCESDGTEGDFHRMQIAVQDWPDQDLFTHLKAANAFINGAREVAEEGVLVHCYQGVSRSATIVAAYLMASHPPVHSSDIAAVTFIRTLRPIVQPNSGFLSQLALYGRCGCDLDAHPMAVEAWRAGRVRTWEGRLDRKKREEAEEASGKQWRKKGWEMCTLM